MARVSAIVLLQLSVLLVLTLSTSTDGLPLEERLEQLTRDFVRIPNSFFSIIYFIPMR